MLSFWILFMTARFGVCHFLWSNHVGHVTNLPQTGTCTVYVLTGGLLLSYVNIFVGVIGLSGPDNFATVHYPLWWQQCSPKKDKSCFAFCNLWCWYMSFVSVPNVANRERTTVEPLKLYVEYTTDSLERYILIRTIYVSPGDIVQFIR